MAPVREMGRGVMVFCLPPERRVALSDRRDLLHAVRRALMALARNDNGNVPPLFSGHEADGAPANSGQHRHVFLACADLDRDSHIDQVIVAAPWACDRSVRPAWAERAEFNRVTALLKLVRTGKLGVIPLRSSSADQRLNGPAGTWESHTDYRPTRHAKRAIDFAALLLSDVAVECQRRGLPKPEIELLDLSVGPNGRIAARLRLKFAAAVAGPILLGRDSHTGGGLFAAIM